MREKGITLDDLVELTGKPKPTLSNLLRNGNMTINTLEIFAKALGVEVADLFPVPQGYVHYMEAKNIAKGIRQEQPQAQSMEDIKISYEDMQLFRKFKAFMEQEKEEPKDESLLVNNPAFMQ